MAVCMPSLLKDKDGKQGGQIYKKRRDVKKQHCARRKQVLLGVLNPGGGDTSQSSLKVSSLQ